MIVAGHPDLHPADRALLPILEATREPGIEDLDRHVASPVRWHMQDLLKNIESRGNPVADIEQGYISSASCILANLFAQIGRSIYWDAARGKAQNDEQAKNLLERPYRAPWVRPLADAV